jgi:GT2 family glycosyltransferase
MRPAARRTEPASPPAGSGAVGRWSIRREAAALNDLAQPNPPTSNAAGPDLQTTNGAGGRGISIVIPTWNGLDLLRTFLPSIRIAAARYAAGRTAPVEMLIVDDGSTDGTAEFLRSEQFEEQDASSGPRGGLQQIFLRNRTNLGFNAAVNRGLRAASQPLVLLLNNDVEAPPDALAALARHFADPQVLGAHGRTVNADSGEECGAGQLLGFGRGFLRVHRGYQAEEGRGAAAPLYSAFASGGAALYDRDKLLGLGGLDPLLSPAYWEDVEVSYRAWKRGYAVIYEPQVTFRHRVSSTMRRLSKANIERLQQRNRLLYHWVHLHDRGLLAAHVVWVALLGISAPIRLQPGFLGALRDALAVLPEVRRRRREERSAARRTDREVLKLFEEFSRRPEVVPREK